MKNYSQYIKLFIATFCLAACTEDLEYLPNEQLTRSSMKNYEAIHVSPNGEDTNDGLSYLTPVKSLSRAKELSKSESRKRILLLGGVHRHSLELSGHSDEMVIESYPGEKATISGLEKITTTWNVHSGNIYVTEPNIKPWQLFEDGEMVNAARWPNVTGYIEDDQPLGRLGAVNEGSILDIKRWVQSDVGTYDGSSTHNGKTEIGKECSITGNTDGFAKLSDLNYSVEGAIAILNIASYKSYYTSITSHSVGSNTFTYNTEAGWEWRKPQHAAFYLEGKLEMLDKEGEWFYDTATGKLYIWCKDSTNPNDKEIYGKTQTYAINMRNTSNITISGIDFVGTTVFGTICDNIKIIDCNFKYPSSSRRMLREEEHADDNCIAVTGLYKRCNNNTVANCTFRYTDGEGLIIDGDNNLIQNNIFKNIDIACANLRSLGGSVIIFGKNMFLNNEISVCATSATLIVGAGSLIEGNHMHSIGYLESDGAVVQSMQAQSPRTVVRNNWIHSCEKYAVRVDSPGSERGDAFDGAPGDPTTFITVVDNIIWDCTGIMVKGDYHLVANNTLFTTYDQSLELPCTITVLIGDGNANKHTVTYDNLADLVTGWHRDKDKWDTLPPPEDTFNNYVSYYTNNTIITDLVQDASNMDFRPYYSDILVDKGLDYTLEDYMNELQNSHTNEDEGGDIGAVEYNSQDYKLPGAQRASSSSPIPADGATSNSARLMLAWKPAWGSSNSIVYMGSASNNLTKVYETNLSCYYPDKSVEALNARKQRIYWRVDCVVDDETVRGEEWFFDLK